MKQKDLSEYFSKMGKKGAKTRAEKLTPEQRKEIASKAAIARWADKGAKPAAKKATTKKVARKKAA